MNKARQEKFAQALRNKTERQYLHVTEKPYLCRVCLIYFRINRASKEVSSTTVISRWLFPKVVGELRKSYPHMQITRIVRR